MNFQVVKLNTSTCAFIILYVHVTDNFFFQIIASHVGLLEI